MLQKSLPQKLTSCISKETFLKLALLEGLLQDGRGWPYTHALDRATATLHLNVEHGSLYNNIEEQFAKEGYNADDFLRLDLQVLAMIDNAISHLNSNGDDVEDKSVPEWMVCVRYFCRQVCHTPSN